MSSLPQVLELSPPPDPIEACERCLDLPFVLLLDSAGVDEHGRYSFLAVDPPMVIRTKGPVTGLRVEGSEVWRATASDALGTAHGLLARFGTQPVDGLPPFQGGVAGYLGYEFGSAMEGVRPATMDELSLPDAVLGLYDRVVAWDHAEKRSWIVSTGVPAPAGGARDERARARLQELHERLLGARRASAWPPLRRRSRRRSNLVPTYLVPDVPGAAGIELRSTFTPAGYQAQVARVREYILAGDIFQANLAQRFELELHDDPFTTYRRLRDRNPAPFSAYFITEEGAVLCSSPERFLQVDQRGRVTTSPIKGTRPRGGTPAEDDALGRELLASEKDRAENIMIADLLRNDLSRVCRPGTVRASSLLALERHPTVHHLVSTIEGELEAGQTAIDLLRAAFPGGSITGAPKVRAMEIIAELEPTTRGVYCGSVGYLSLTGELDTNIAIRTGVSVAGRCYFSAGGGIVSDSVPEAEYVETLDKAQGFIRAFQTQDSDPWSS